jgi:hypothetical protein
MGTPKDTFRHREDHVTLAYVDDASALTRSLEDREAERLGSLVEGRKRLARRIGCAPGTLRNLRIGRLKRVEMWLYDRLEALLIEEMEREIAKLSHELLVARARKDARQAEKVAALEAAIAHARRVIDGEGE